MPKYKKFGLCADHAQIKFLKPKEQIRMGFSSEPQLVKRVRWNRVPFINTAIMPRYTLAMCLAHLLYPENFPKIIACHVDKRTTFSVAVELDKKSEAGIKAFYNRGHNPVGQEKYVGIYSKHCKRVSEIAPARRSTILTESGLFANVSAMNVGVSKKGELVFFEVLEVHIPTLEAKIASLPEGEKKKKALELFKALKQEAHGKEILDVHE